MRAQRLGVPAVVLVLTAILAVGTASAEEIVHFTNGTSMAIRSHNVEDGMVHVDLGGNALMAFPIAQVERITEAGADVYLPPSYRPANVTAEGEGRVRVQVGGASGGAPVSGRTSARSGRGSNKAREVEDALSKAIGGPGITQGGVGLVTPFPNHANPAMRNMNVAGRVGAMRGAGLQNGTLDSLGRSVSGEYKMAAPNSTKRDGTDVRRFLPSDSASRAAAAEGRTLRSPAEVERPAAPPAESAPPAEPTGSTGG